MCWSSLTNQLVKKISLNFGWGGSVLASGLLNQSSMFSFWEELLPQ